MTSPEQKLPEPLPREPLSLASAWLAQAWAAKTQPNPDAMVLATCDLKGRPSARVVLCKQLVADPGYILFYTNYRSRKGRELLENRRAAGVLHWDAMHRQLRVEGQIELASEAESDAYFASRAWQSRVGAWASEQSEPIASRSDLVTAWRTAAKRLNTPDPTQAPPQAAPETAIPRPEHWGGFRLWLESVELWVEGEYRIHDRARWTRILNRNGGGSGFTSGSWSVSRLQP